MLKESGNGIYNAIKMYQEGTLEMGTSVLWGIKDGCIGLAKDELYEQYVPEDIRTAIDEIEQKLIAGEITVTSELY